MIRFVGLSVSIRTPVGPDRLSNETDYPTGVLHLIHMPPFVQRHEYICYQCGKSFYKLPSQMVNKEHTFCSYECRYAFRHSGKWTPPNKFSDEELLDNVRNLANLLQRMPEPKDLTCPSYPPYQKRWHSWKVVLQLAGIPESGYLLNELRRVASLLGHTPTDQEMRAHGIYSTQRYWTTFGSWQSACKLAGLLPHTTHEGGPHRVPKYHYVRKDGLSVRLVGSYERRFAQVLDALNLEWSVHGEFDSIPYHDQSGELHHYMPDFYVKPWNTYIETKGWYQDKDRLKMSIIMREYPSLSIIVVEKDALAYFEKKHKLQML